MNNLASFRIVAAKNCGPKAKALLAYWLIVHSTETC